MNNFKNNIICLIVLEYFQNQLEKLNKLIYVLNKDSVIFENDHYVDVQ